MHGPLLVEPLVEQLCQAPCEEDGPGQPCCSHDAETADRLGGYAYDVGYDHVLLVPPKHVPGGDELCMFAPNFEPAPF